MTSRRVRLLQYTILFASSATFFVVDRLPDAVAEYVTERELLGIALISLGTLFLSTHAEMIDIKMQRSTLISCRTLPEALDAALSTRPRFNTLRVFAQSSENIVPGIKGRDVRIENARVMLRDFGSTTEEHKVEQANVARMANEWRLVRDEDKTIGAVAIGHYSGPPIAYVVICDRSAAVVGWYFRKGSAPSEDAEFTRPFLILPKDEAGRHVIEDLIGWFDRHYEGWKAPVPATGGSVE